MYKSWQKWYLAGYLVFLVTHCATDSSRDTPAVEVAPAGDTFVLY